MLLFLSTLAMLPPQAAYAISASDAVNGRILPPAKSGDNVNWIEIARSGDKSLILRSSYLNWYPQPNTYNVPLWQYMPFSDGHTNYLQSMVYSRVNNWFNGLAASTGDNLPANARLRQFTYENNAKSVLGTATTTAGLTNGFSSPSSVKRGTGNDIAFVLSFSEAVSFMASYSFIRGRNPATAPTGAIAQANSDKLNIPPIQTGYVSSGMWLRSVGDITGTMGVVVNEGGYRLRAFQHYVTYDMQQRAYMYPALWVDSAIFLDPTFNVTYYPNGGSGNTNVYPVPVNSFYTVVSQG